MLKNKRILLIIILAIALFLIPNICKATDTFTTSDGIVAKKVVDSTGGTIEIRFSNINLNEEINYTWGIGKSTTLSEVEKWYALGDFSQQNKSAVITLTPTDNKVGKILRETNNAWLFIKDNTNDTLVVNALKVDLTLPLLKAFNISENQGTSTFRSFHIRSVYNIDNLYYNIQKITDEKVISDYTKAKLEGKDLSTINSLANIDDAPQIGWKVVDESYTAINDFYIHKKPTDSGIYYVWIKAKDTDSKMVYGYSIFGLDNESPVVSSIKVTSPSEGTCKTGQTVKVRVNFNETITGTTVPTLKIRFGDSAERALTNGTIKDNYIEYSYNIQDNDKGQIATVSLSGGTIKDAYNNDAKLSCPIIAGYTLKANVEGTQNDQTENEDTTQYISFPFIIYNGKSSLDVKNYNGNYKLYYQFVEVNDNQFDELEKLKEKYKKAEITYPEFLTQYKQILPSYDDTNWIEMSDGKFEKDLSNFNGTKKFALWAKLVMDTKTVYEAEVYTMDGSGTSTNTPDEIDKVTDKDQTEKESTKDTTIKNDSKLPQTGITLLSLVAVSLMVVAVISKVKYGKYKDI